jgi:hypothetical protein
MNHTQATAQAAGRAERGRRTLVRFMRYGTAQPASLVRGSSRRIMTMRFRPANIRVINRRVCSWAVLGLLFKTKTPNTRCSKLTSRNVFPPTPPVEVLSMPERCSLSRIRFAAPNYGAPLTAVRRSGQTVIATGGSGGNTRRRAALKRQKAGFPPVGRKAGLIQNTVKPGGA